MYINGKPVFKGYQIGINKPLHSLSHLNKEKIKMDLLYFISKINKILNKKINEFSFGIITTKNAYDSQKNNKNNFNNDFELNNNDDINDDKKEEENDIEYKNYNCMKTFCNDNNYEFLIFDPKNNNFYIDKDNNLKKIVFLDYYDNEFKNIITNYIFKNEENYNLIKLPLFPKEIKKIELEYIRKSLNELIKDKQLNYVGKFQKKKDIKIDFNNLINDNFIIYLKDKDKKKNIFFNKKFFCDDCKDSNIFYVYDVSLNKIRRKKNDITMPQNTNLFIYYKKDDNNEKNKVDNSLLHKKTFRNIEDNNEESVEEKREKNDEESESDE